MSNKTVEIPLPSQEQLKAAEIPAPEVKLELTIAELQEMANVFADELNEIYADPLQMKIEAEKLFKAAGERQAELLEAYYQKTGVKFQPAFKEKFTVSVII